MIWRMAFSCRRVLSTCSRSLRLDIGAEPGEDRLVQRREVVAEHRLARGDGDLSSGGDGENAAAHRTIMPRSISARPTHHRDREAGQKIRVARQYPETAAGVFGAQRQHPVFIDDDRQAA